MTFFVICPLNVHNACFIISDDKQLNLSLLCGCLRYSVIFVTCNVMHGIEVTLGPIYNDKLLINYCFATTMMSMYLWPSCGNTRA